MSTLDNSHFDFVSLQLWTHHRDWSSVWSIVIAEYSWRSDCDHTLLPGEVTAIDGAVKIVGGPTDSSALCAGATSGRLW